MSKKLSVLIGTEIKSIRKYVENTDDIGVKVLYYPNSRVYLDKVRNEIKDFLDDPEECLYIATENEKFLEYVGEVVSEGILESKEVRVIRVDGKGKGTYYTYNKKGTLEG